jgi:hypothetical protein
MTGQLVFPMKLAMEKDRVVDLVMRHWLSGCGATRCRVGLSASPGTMVIGKA